MNIVKTYFLENWALILVLMAFVISLMITVFLDKKTIRRMYILISAVFVLSFIVFFEFYLGEIKEYPNVRATLTAIRYSATPLIIAFILYTLARRMRFYVFIPAAILTIINIISIFTGIVFSIADDGSLQRGILGYLPYVGVGGYSVVLVYTLIKQSNKQISELIPIIFLAFSLGTGIILPLPFAFGKDYSKVFCTTIAIALFVYYVFLILQLTKKDALTGLLNRQAYYASINRNGKDITAFVSIDMNGLKTINDNYGHAEGDNAIETVALCFLRATKYNQHAYRIGGDEFIIVCWKTSEEDLRQLIANIQKNLSHTKYSCSIGYCYAPSGSKSLEDMVKESDKMMYEDKANYYQRTGNNRRVA